MYENTWHVIVTNKTLTNMCFLCVVLFSLHQDVPHGLKVLVAIISLVLS